MARLIAIEGLDGSGKNTQSTMLANYLTERGFRVKSISFPNYGSGGARPVEMYLSGEMGDHADSVNAYAASMLFAVDRYSSFKTDWQSDAGRDDTVIIANRYTTANAYHQLAKLPDSEWEEFLTWLWDLEFTKLGLPAPDDVICLAMEPAASDRLVEKRCAEQSVKKDIHEADGEYMKKCHRAMYFAARRLGWKVIECSEGGVILPREKIFAELLCCLGYCDEK